MWVHALLSLVSINATGPDSVVEKLKEIEECKEEKKEEREDGEAE